MHIKTFKSLSKNQFQWVSGKIDLFRRTLTEVRGKVYMQEVQMQRKEII